jgi:hypothetical protein
MTVHRLAGRPEMLECVLAAFSPEISRLAQRQPKAAAG